jgi:hypothetical protein
MAMVAGVAIAATACGASGGATMAQPAAGQPSAWGGPVVVNCGAGQQASIRPVVMNGQSVSQVECVASPASAAVLPQTMVETAAMAPGTPGMPFAPAGYANVVATGQPASYVPIGAVSALPQAQMLPATYAAPVYPAPVAVQSVQPVATRVARVADDDYVTYRPARRRAPPRSVKKSAVIIGSSAGVGAGIGAAAGGKKGALIGALIGGGGATLWDQITRARK